MNSTDVLVVMLSFFFSLQESNESNTISISVCIYCTAESRRTLFDTCQAMLHATADY